jgi:geranylgeranyl diphosphate synthase type II
MIKMHSMVELKEMLEAYLQQEQIRKEPAGLYEPNNYFLQIGGKRLRPVLLLLTTEVFGGKAEDALPAALAVEYFHNFSLIHDDVMDAAPLRRGFATLHEKYNLNTAILSGDVLLIKAFEYLGKTDPSKFKLLFDVFIQTAIEVCEGQQYDINFEKQETVIHSEYIEMIRLKTAVLLAASMKMGAILGGADDTPAQLIYEYAENLGIAFQVQDDILDCYGDEKLVGKQPGGDILQNKKTLLMIEALQRCSAHGDPALMDWLAKTEFDNEEKRKAVLHIFDRYQIKEFGLQQRDAYIGRSMKALEGLPLPESRKTVLSDLVRHLVLRAF